MKTKLQHFGLRVKAVLSIWYRFWFVAHIDERRLSEIRDEHCKYYYLAMRH